MASAFQANRHQVTGRPCLTTASATCCCNSPSARDKLLRLLILDHPDRDAIDSCTYGHAFTAYMSARRIRRVALSCCAHLLLAVPWRNRSLCCV
jgi:hypothetical protein